MSFARLMPLVLLMALPLIVLLYMIRQKAKSKSVTSTYLWREAYKNLQSDTPWEKLKHNLLMYLQLLTALLIVLACMAPFIRSNDKKAENIVYVVDTSASMDMKQDGRSRLESSKADILRSVSELKPETNVTIVTVGDTDDIVYSGKASGVMLSSAVNSIRVGHEGGSAYDSLDYIRMLGSAEDTRTYIYTDTLFETSSDIIRIVNVGGDADNYSIDYLQGVYGADGELTEYIGVTNHCKLSKLNSDLAIYVDGELYAVLDTDVEPGSSKTYACLLDSNGVEKIITVELCVDDALAGDNKREDFVIKKDTGRICLITERNTFLENAILASEKYELVMSSSAENLPDDCEIFVFDNIFPDKYPAKPSLSFEAGEKTEKLSLTDSDYTFSMGGVKCYDSDNIIAPLIYTEDGRVAAMYAEDDGIERAFVGFDLHMGDFVLDADFPIFLNKILSELTRSTVKTPELYEFPISESGVMSGYSVNGVTGSMAGVFEVGDTSATDLTVYFIIAVCVLLLIISAVFLLRRENMCVPVARIICLVLLVLAIFNPSIHTKQKGRNIAYLIDMSDSNYSNRTDMENFVRDAIALRGEKDRQTVIVFGADARTESFMSENSVFKKVTSKPISYATNIENAVNTAISSVNEGTDLDIVLLTDGSENEGSVLLCAENVKNRNVNMSVVLYEEKDEPENYISELNLPKNVEVGNEFSFSIVVESNVATEGILSIYESGNGEASLLKAEKQVSLHEGKNEFVFSDTRERGGLAFYKAVLESRSDTIIENNSFSAYTKAGRSGSFLLVSDDPTDNLLSYALNKAGVNVVNISVNDIPEDILDYSEYDGVILDNVLMMEIDSKAQSALQSFVRDFGGGLITTGGNRAYGIGSMKDTVFEEMLPVSSDIRNKEEIPALSMVYVIDKSGSMGDSLNNSYSKLEMAKSAAANALDNLREIDRVGVIAFDDSFTWQYNINSAAKVSDAKDAISKIHVEGGTSIYPAIKAAADALSKEDTALKHIILLTDGQDSFGAYSSLYTYLNDNGITLSTVAVGEDADRKLLHSMAEGGSGRYYETTNLTELPFIFAQEVLMAMQEYLVNKEFFPILTGDYKILEGVTDNGVYPLYGYVATTPKNNSVVYLESDDGDPILASRRYGLGNVVSYTTDTTYKWSEAYSGTSELVSLYRNIIDFVKTSIADEGSVEVRQNGNVSTIIYTAPEAEAGEVSFTIAGGDSESVNVKGTAIGAGKYMAEINTKPDTSYVVMASEVKDEDVISGVVSGIAGNYSKEYTFANITGLLSFMDAVNAKTISFPNEVYETTEGGRKEEKEQRLLLLILALAFFLTDVALRRFGISFRTVMNKIEAERKPRTARDESQKKDKKDKKEKKEKKEKKQKKKKEDPQDTGLDTEFLFKKQEERKR